MSESLPKIAAFIFFIWLGWFLRRREILKESAFHAVSGLVLYVTIPCIIITNLNGIKIEGIMLLIVFLGFLANVAMLGYAWFLTRKETDEKKRDFWRINMSGYSIGPLAVPYIQAFYPTTGLMTAFMFDVGNVIMSGGGTFAILAGSHEKQRSLLNVLKVIGGKMVRSDHDHQSGGSGQHDACHDHDRRDDRTFDESAKVCDDREDPGQPLVAVHPICAGLRLFHAV